MATVLTAIALGVFGFMCLMSLFKPQWALVLIFSFFGYEQLITSFVPFIAHRSWLMNVITILVSGTAVLFAFIFGRRPFRGVWNINTALIFCLYIFAHFGILYSMMPEAGVYFLKSGAPSVLLMLVLFPLLVFSAEQIRKMCVPLLLVGLALILMILVSPRTELYGTRLLLDMSYTMGSGEFGNPLAIAEVGGLVLIVATLMEPKSKNPLIGILRVLAILFGLLISFLVGSRGQLVFSLFFAVLLYPVAHEIRDIKQFFIRAGSVGFVAVVLGLVIKMFLLSSNASERFSVENISEGIAGRMYFITTMLNEYGARPANYLQGLGSGSFNALVSHDSDDFIYPHNLIIEVLTHHGVIGFTLLCGIFLLTAKHSLALIRAGFSGTFDRSSIAIVLALAGYVTMISMKQGSFLLYPLPFYMYLVISKLYYTWRIDSRTYEPSVQYDQEYDSEY